MALDYAALAHADAALGPVDPAEAAAALNAQAVAEVRDVPCRDARAVLLATGEYGALVLLSRRTPGPDAPAALVAAAITAVATLDTSEAIRAGDEGAWRAIQAMLGAFVDAGALSAASRDALLAMRTVSRPVWPVVLTGHDVATARSL